MSILRIVEGGVELDLKVVPGASRERIVGRLGDALKVQVAAPPERGQANAAVIALVARRLGLQRKDIRIVRGTTSPHKTLLIHGGRPEQITEALGL